MRVHVDRSMCQAHNRCHSVAPDVYELDDMGFAHASITTVPKELEEAARLGALACPERVISVEDDSRN
jgi:ferredoxin